MPSIKSAPESLKPSGTEAAEDKPKAPAGRPRKVIVEGWSHHTPGERLQVDPKTGKVTRRDERK